MESIKDASAIAITEETQVAAARRAAADLCRRLDLSESTTARAELIAVELAGNILNHAKRGTLYMGPTATGLGIQLIASDLGPGLGDVEQAMRDGFSTSTTPGLGLGAVRRKADSIDVYSRWNEGTVFAATLRDRPSGDEANVAVLSTHIEGETLNGDSWAIYPLPGRTIYLVVDGLGHGPNAAVASAAAIRVADAALANDVHISLVHIVQRMHGPMQATRGAAILLVSVAEADGKVLCCGIGNISAVLCAPDSSTRALVSHNGTVGHRMARVQEFEYPASSATLLVMHSDGVSARWKPSQYPGLLQRTPAVIAGVLYRDAVRGRDDATVLVARISPRIHPNGGEQDA